MIKLTGESGEVIYISDEVAYVKLTSRGKTGIKIKDGYVIVTESPEDVARKILEYKLSINDYSNAPSPIRREARLTIIELSGLEVSHDPT